SELAAVQAAFVLGPPSQVLLAPSQKGQASSQRPQSKARVNSARPKAAAEEGCSASSFDESCSVRVAGPPQNPDSRILSPRGCKACSCCLVELPLKKPQPIRSVPSMSSLSLRHIVLFCAVGLALALLPRARGQQLIPFSSETAPAF